MAILKTLAFVLVFFHLVYSDQMLIERVVQSPSPSPLPSKIDCKEACDVRCKLSSRPRLCNRACGTCCARCNCVPPGTSGNYGVCPCYANMKTHGSRHKCP